MSTIYMTEAACAAKKTELDNHLAYVERCIGPRQVGKWYKGGWSNEEYVVLGINRLIGPFGNTSGWCITVANRTELEQGRSRTHCTAWDYKTDKVI
jgi:hypothetical protein